MLMKSGAARFLLNRTKGIPPDKGYSHFIRYTATSANWRGFGQVYDPLQICPMKAIRVLREPHQKRVVAV